MNQTNNTKIETITGGVAKDERGQIRFVNAFDMTRIKRFYIIENSTTHVFRGWRGHRTEQRWFYVLSGVFYIYIVKIDDWENTSQELPVTKFIRGMDDQQVLCVPAGYATAFRALEEDSALLVFADHGIENAKNDDFVWPADYFLKCN